MTDSQYFYEGNDEVDSESGEDEGEQAPMLESMSIAPTQTSGTLSHKAHIVLLTDQCLSE